MPLVGKGLLLPIDINYSYDIRLLQCKPIVKVAKERN
jgi:hypothetical protein